MLSILIPVYNEKYLIRALIDKVLAAPLPASMQREIIIVDDFSTDGTWDILTEIVSNNPKIKLFRNEKNQGKGASIAFAIQKATGDIAVFQDADLEYDPNEYIELLAPILKGVADVVYGTRFSTGRPRRVLFFHHSLGNKLLTFVSNFFTGLNLTDMEVCYKVFKMQLLKSIPIRAKRFGIEPEITAKVAKRGFRVYEVPVSYFGRTYSEGKKINWKDGVEAFFIILKYWLIDDLYVEKDANTLFRFSHTHRFNKWMAQVIAPYIGDRVLEIGSGIGNITQPLLPRERYICSDIDPLHIHTLKNTFYGRPNVRIIQMDIAGKIDPSLKDEKINSVICLNVLEHIKNDKHALENINKVLVKGGRLILLVPHLQSLFSTLDEIVKHERRYSEKDLRKIVAESGFKIERVFQFNRVSTPGWVLNGKILKRRTFSMFQLKVYDTLVWFFKLIDRFLPWPGQSIICVARKIETPG